MKSCYACEGRGYVTSDEPYMMMQGERCNRCYGSGTNVPAPSTCFVERFSSRMCTLGTKSCILDHGTAGVEAA